MQESVVAYRYLIVFKYLTKSATEGDFRLRFKRKCGSIDAFATPPLPPPPIQSHPSPSKQIDPLKVYNANNPFDIRFIKIKFQQSFAPQL